MLLRGGVSTELGDTCLSCFPEIYYSVSVRLVVCTHFLDRYFNACNAIDNQNRMRQSGLELNKYWVIQSGYFRFASTVALGTGVTYGNLLYCHGVIEGNMDKKISKLDYNNSTVYEFFNNPFTADFVSPALHLPPITIYDIPCPVEKSLIYPISAPSCHLCCL